MKDHKLSVVIDRAAGFALLSTAEVAERVGLNIEQVYGLAKRGDIPCIRTGKNQRHYQFHPAEIERWMEEGRERAFVRVLTEEDSDALTRLAEFAESVTAFLARLGLAPVRPNPRLR